MEFLKGTTGRFKSPFVASAILLAGAILAICSFDAGQTSFSLNVFNSQVPFPRLLGWPKHSLSIEGLVSVYVWPRPVTPVGPMTNVSLVSAFCDRGVLTVYKESTPRAEGECNFVVINTGLDQYTSGENYPTHPVHAEYGWQCLLCTAQPSNTKDPSDQAVEDFDGVIRWNGVQVNGSDRSSWQPQRPTLGSSPLVDLTCRRTAGVEMDESWSYNWGWNPAQFKCPLARVAQGSERRPTWAALVMQQDNVEAIEQRLFAEGGKRSLARFVAVEDLAPPPKREVDPDKLNIGTCLQSPIYGMKNLDKRRQKMLVEWVAYNLYVQGVSHVYIYLNQGDLQQRPSPFLEQIAYMAKHWNVTVVELGTLSVGLGYVNQYEMVADCYYRASSVHDYVAFHDFDEFPTSPGVETSRWTDTLWQELQMNDVGVFNFLNINVLGMCPHRGKGINADLVTASETYSDFEYGSDRVKMLVKAGAARYVYVHYVRGLSPNLRNVWVDPSRFYMRHFTDSRYVSVDNCSSVELEKKKMRRSFILLRFQDTLGEKLNEVMSLGRSLRRSH